MPPASSIGSSRRKLGQPTVCLECYLRKVKCDRQRPCNTCVRRGTEHLCKTFNTSQLDPQTLQKKQARRSLAEINALLEASPSDHADDPDPQQLPTDLQQAPPEHPMMAFINLMLQDLNVHPDATAAAHHASSHASSDADSASSRTGSPAAAAAAAGAPTRSAVARYLDPACLAKIVAFCAMLPDWTQLDALLQVYLWQVDWKFLITAQDLLQDQMKELWIRVVLPAQRSSRGDRGGSPSTSLAVAAAAAEPHLMLQPGDLSRLALLACVLGETVESMAPDAIAEVLPICRPGTVAPGPVSVEPDTNPRVKALLLLTYHVAALIEECVRLDEMTLELVQANLSAFSLWSNQGLHGTGSTEFPRWNVTIRAAKARRLFEDPGSNTPNLSQLELDHRRRLAWLVYGYDHAFAVGANTKPLIVESQFSVDQPSDAPPWAACGAPRDACLAKLEKMGGQMAQLVSSTLCYGAPLHRKAMETDQKIAEMLSQLDASYKADNPDLSMDAQDPFRARRRCWLQLTTAWQRGSLHRQFFSPNGRTTHGELATSRHIATDSALRSIFGVRALRRLQNRFSDHMGSAWWYQYLTEPCLTLATAALLLIRSQGRGVAGLADAASCWSTVMHFTRTIDECIQDLQDSTRDAAACLPSLLPFAHGCVRLIQQLRQAVHKSFDAFVQSRPDLGGVKAVEIDPSVMALLHPRSRTRSPVGMQKRRESAEDKSSSGNGGKQGGKRSSGEGSRRGSAAKGGGRQVSVTAATPAIGLAASLLESSTSLGAVPPIQSTGLPTIEAPIPPGTLSLSFSPTSLTFPSVAPVPAPAAPLHPSNPPASSAAPATPLLPSLDTTAAAALPTASALGPSYLPPPPAPPFSGYLLSPAEPLALRDFYSDETDDGSTPVEAQRFSSRGGGPAGAMLQDWFAGGDVGMDVG